MWYAAVPKGLDSKQKDLWIQQHQQESYFFQALELDDYGGCFDKAEPIAFTWKPLAIEEKRDYFSRRNNGVKTNCDDFVYDVNLKALETKMKSFIAFYEACRLKQQCLENSKIITWHDKLRAKCLKNIPLQFDAQKIKKVYYYPLIKKWLYVDQ